MVFFLDGILVVSDIYYYIGIVILLLNRKLVWNRFGYKSFTKHNLYLSVQFQQTSKEVSVVFSVNLKPNRWKTTTSSRIFTYLSLEPNSHVVCKYVSRIAKFCPISGCSCYNITDGIVVITYIFLWRQFLTILFCSDHAHNNIIYTSSIVFLI